MKKIIDKVLERKGKSRAPEVVSSIKNREAVGNTKKGVNLVSIVQKLTERKEGEKEESPSESGDTKK